MFCLSCWMCVYNSSNWWEGDVSLIRGFFLFSISRILFERNFSTLKPFRNRIFCIQERIARFAMKNIAWSKRLLAQVRTRGHVVFSVAMDGRLSQSNGNWIFKAGSWLRQSKALFVSFPCWIPTQKGESIDNSSRIYTSSRCLFTASSIEISSRVYLSIQRFVRVRGQATHKLFITVLLNKFELENQNLSNRILWTHSDNYYILRDSQRWRLSVHWEQPPFHITKRGLQVSRIFNISLHFFRR